MAALLGALAALAAADLAAAEPVAPAHWQRHPEIVEIRTVYREIRRALKMGRLRRETRTFQSCQAYDDSHRTAYFGAGGVVRMYEVSRGSEDSAIRAAYYYDRRGALRLVLAKAGAANGTAYAYTIYVGRSGQRLWQDRRHLKGPGYTFPSELPDTWLIRDPKQAFDAPDPCRPM